MYRSLSEQHLGEINAVITDEITVNARSSDFSSTPATKPQYPLQRFSVAPMLDWTDRHCRYFHRLLTKQALLYTEMVTTGAIIHGKADYLAYSEQDHPVALQLGGSDPQALAHCAKLAEQRGYNEINLNVGCPSDRVQNGRFGACLMGEADLVADCIKAMRDAVAIPVTVKPVLGLTNWIAMSFYANSCKPSQNVANAKFSLFMPVKPGSQG